MLLTNLHLDGVNGPMLDYFIVFALEDGNLCYGVTKDRIARFDILLKNRACVRFTPYRVYTPKQYFDLFGPVHQHFYCDRDVRLDHEASLYEINLDMDFACELGALSLT